MGNKLIRDQLIHIYGNTCFLGDTPTPDNILTLHHISPVRDGRQNTICNGALMTENMHWLFNIIESNDPMLAEHINNYIVYYKETMDDEARMIIRKVMVEYYFSWMKSRKKVIVNNHFMSTNESNEEEEPEKQYVLKRKLGYDM